MEPRNQGLEHLPQTFSQTPEKSPSVFTPEKERSFEPNQEHLETRTEVASASSQPVPILPPPIQPAQPTVPATLPTASDDSVPLTANDDDLIEKEWVDKAKAIIVQTKDDPYEREKEVSKLQVEYLRKRYGKELGAS